MKPPDLKRLVAIAERFRSPFDAERASAATLFCRVLDAHGLSFADVLHADPPAPVVVRTDRNWRQTAEQCLYDHTQALTPFESEFLTSILLKGYALSEKQDVILRRIARKTGVPAWSQDYV